MCRSWKTSRPAPWPWPSRPWPSCRARAKPRRKSTPTPNYKKCLTAYNDFAATLTEKQDHIKDLEGDIGEYDGSIANHKINLQQLQRDIEKLKSEAADAVADVITSKEETRTGRHDQRHFQGWHGQGTAEHA